MCSRISSRLAALGRSSTALILLLCLTACGSLSQSSFEAARLAISRNTLVIDARQVAALPYAQMRVDGPDGEALMVLGNDDDGLTSWYSPDGRIVFLRNGVLAGTKGWSSDAIDIRSIGEDPLADPTRIERAQTRRIYDWMPGYRYGVELKGELRRRDIEAVDILGTSHRLQRYEEVLVGPDVAFTNIYWVEPDSGYIRKSLQIVAPGVALELTQLKPYRPTVPQP